MTRNGKIARLPLHVRAKLNQLLQNGQEGKLLIQWLNDLPDVQAVLKEHFDGQPINDVNLSAWKTGGYLDWEADQQMTLEVNSFMEGTNELQRTADDSLTGRLTLFLAANMASETRRLNALPDGPERVKAWRELTGCLLSLVRGELNCQKLRLERDKYDERVRRRLEEEQKPEMTREEREERIRQILSTD